MTGRGSGCLSQGYLFGGAKPPLPHLAAYQRGNERLLRAGRHDRRAPAASRGQVLWLSFAQITARPAARLADTEAARAPYTLVMRSI